MELIRISTKAELATEFNRLRGDKSYGMLDMAAKALPPREGRQLVLPSSTLSGLLGGKSVPSRDTVVTFLSACGIRVQDQQPWLAACERVAQAHRHGPPGAQRVRDARPRLLGVRAAIQVVQPHPGPAAGEVPTYVPRDLDADLQTAITVSSERGGFVLLTGRPAVGKTRSLFEAVTDVLPNWWLLQPSAAAEVCDFAEAPCPQTVVWLDEVQRYLDHPGGLPAGAMRRLLMAGVVVLATVQRNELHRRTTGSAMNTPHRHVADRELLELAEIMAVPGTFSIKERRRAQRLLCTDRRIRIALESQDTGFTQVMAAGPQLIRHWEHAAEDHCYGAAVITAAVDARRVGAQAPVTRDFLHAAAPAYLTPAQQATASVHADVVPGGERVPHCRDDWLDTALSYATTPMLGAACALIPAPAGMGRIAGYRTESYLYQHAQLVRRVTPVPDATWQALIKHHAHNSGELADHARRRDRLHEAEVFYQRAIDAGDEFAAFHRASWLVEQERIDEAIAVLRPFARPCLDNGLAVNKLADLLFRRGKIDDAIDVLSPYAAPGAGRDIVVVELADLFVKLGRIDEAIHVLGARAAAGEDEPAVRRAELLVQQGKVGQAIAVLRVAVAHDTDKDGRAIYKLTDLLAGSGKHDQAIALLRSYVERRVEFAVRTLAELLASQGSVDELEALVYTYGDTRPISRRLTDLLSQLLARSLADQDRIDELMQRAHMDQYAAIELARRTAEQGHFDDAVTTLRPSAGPHREAAVVYMADLLLAQGKVDEAIAVLRPCAEAGSMIAASQAADLLLRQGNIDDAIAMFLTSAAAGNVYAPGQAASLLVEQGKIDEAIAVLRQQVASNDIDLLHATQLVGLLARMGRIDELRAEVAAGTHGAAQALRQHLMGQPVPLVTCTFPMDGSLLSIKIDPPSRIETTTDRRPRTKPARQRRLVRLRVGRVAGHTGRRRSSNTPR